MSGRWYVTGTLICISLIANDIEIFIMCIFAICMFSFMNHLFKSII